MNTIPSESDSNAILDRLLSGAGLHRDAQLAALLGVSPQAVSQARRKRKIPEGWVVKVSQQCGLSMDWLMFGKGDESTPVASHAPVASSTSQASTPAGAAVPDLDLLCIPLVAASLSAGVGSLQTEADVLDYFAFRSDWLCRKGNPDKMVLMKVYGDSMEPEICHGDMALIDQSKQQIYPHTIYAVGVNEEIYIKQIETLPGCFSAASTSATSPSKWICAATWPSPSASSARSSGGVGKHSSKRIGEDESKGITLLFSIAVRF